MIYTKDQIELLGKAILGDKMAHNQLNENFTKLALALKGDAKAIEWLLVNDKLLAAFDDAVGGNRSAIKFLMQKNEITWAAVANYLNGDDNAIEWLGQHGFSHFIKLAQCIKKMQEKESGKDVSFFFTP